MPNVGPNSTTKQRLLFAEYLLNKDAISEVGEVRDGVFMVKKRGVRELLVQLVDIYTVSEADVHRLMGEEPSTKAIVTASNWNTYTVEAKALARANGIGLFNWKEFMGAIHKDGNDFVDFKS